MEDPLARLPFVHETLSTLRGELAGSGATLLGFIGTPWTLAAYSVEGRAERNCRRTKTMMHQRPEVLHALLAHLADALAAYACYQVEAGAQVVQLFDSWAHHLTPEQHAEFSLPYSERVMAAVRAKHPGVPLILHANGGAGKHAQLAACSADVVGLDWECTMAAARQAMGAGRTLQVGGVCVCGRLEAGAARWGHQGRLALVHQAATRMNLLPMWGPLLLDVPSGH
jgi:uroporphyrinogen decarboxylase